MSGLKAFFKLKIPQEHNIMGLSEERYDVLKCEYQFHQYTTSTGEVNSDIKGGIIELLVSSMPSDSLLAWTFDHMKRFNGEVTITDVKGETLEQVYFEDARCYNFRMKYNDEDMAMITELKIASRHIKVGNTYFELSDK